MNLKAFTAFMFQEKAKFEALVKNRAQDINLDELLAQIRANASSPAGGMHSDGQPPIEVSLEKGGYFAVMYPQQLVLYGPGDFELRRFSGEQVERAYQDLARQFQEQGKVSPF